MRFLPRCLAWLALLALAGPAARGADAPMAEIVVAMRYFQQTGASHSHLYLYRVDGKLLRQLTDSNAGQDREPIFAPDGASIVFTRKNDKGGVEYWSVEPRGGNLRKIPAAPDWYAGAKNAPLLNLSDLTEELPADEAAYDKQQEALTDLTSGEPVALSQRPALSRPVDLLAFGQDKKRQLLDIPPLRLAFFSLHLNSTDGTSSFALDLGAKRIARLSPNWAAVFPLPGEPAFLTWTENRYVPYGDGQHTANSSYIEHWDAALRPVRYAEPKAAGACQGASMYRPKGDPAVVALRPESE